MLYHCGIQQMTSPDLWLRSSSSLLWVSNNGWSISTSRPLVLMPWFSLCLGLWTACFCHLCDQLENPKPKNTWPKWLYLLSAGTISNNQLKMIITKKKTKNRNLDLLRKHLIAGNWQRLVFHSIGVSPSTACQWSNDYASGGLQFDRERALPKIGLFQFANSSARLFNVLLGD